MSNSLRSLKRQQDRDSDELPEAQQKLPTGRVIGDPLRGTFNSLPLVGWMAVRQRDRNPIVMLRLALLGRETNALFGGLEVELPLYRETEAATVAALERYGWTGATWTVGDPFPFGDESTAELLSEAMSQAGLRATLLFTGDEDGNKTQEVEIMRAQGPFLMAPLSEPKEPPSQERVRSLREIAKDYRRFFVEPSDA